MGQLRVLVENDRLLTPGSARGRRIPTVETGPDRPPLVALESAGRDEVVVGR